MAIVIEEYEEDGRHLVKTYSDSGRYIERDGIEYSEAIDFAEFGYVYTEGRYIEEEDIDEQDDKAKAFDILIGVEE